MIFVHCWLHGCAAAQVAFLPFARASQDDAPSIPKRCVYEVLTAAYELYDKRANEHGALQEVPPPTSANEKLKVCGDTHGQLQDVLLIFKTHGPPSEKNHYLFNGDMADRGRNGIEIFMLLLAFKLACPEAVFMNRGNHEQRDLNERPFAQGGGFAWECRAKSPPDENLIELFQRYAAQLWRNSCAIRRYSLTAHPSPQVLLPDARRRDVLLTYSLSALPTKLDVSGNDVRRRALFLRL